MPDVTMPQLGETVTEGTVTRWFKKVGDEVAEDEPLFEVSTDKVDTEVPSSVSGVLTEVLVEEGGTVDVGTKLAVITVGSGSGAAAAGGMGAGGMGADAPVAAPVDPPAREPDAPPEPMNGSESTDGADDPGRAAAASSAEPSTAPSPEPASSRATATAADPSASRSGARRLLSPVVRRLIAEHDLDPDSIVGTGFQERITRDDVLAHLDQAAGSTARSVSRPEAAAEANSQRSAPTIAPAARSEGDEVIRFSNIRRRTAQHMVHSLEVSAHVLTVIEVDFDNVDRVRTAAKGRWKAAEGFSLTYLPFVSRAVVDALRSFPKVNASVENDSLVVHRAVHLGFAVDLSFEGLIVPVVHDADAKRLRTIARELSDLAARARSKKLNADEITGGTFAITNPGSYGTMMTFPVINQPNVAILSTDGVKKKPVAIELPDGSDAIAIHPVGNLALSFDHRAFDGAYASAFLARVRDILETHDWAQEL